MNSLLVRGKKSCFVYLFAMRHFPKEHTRARYYIKGQLLRSCREQVAWFPSLPSPAPVPLKPPSGPLPGPPDSCTPSWETRNQHRSVSAPGWIPMHDGAYQAEWPPFGRAQHVCWLQRGCQSPTAPRRLRRPPTCGSHDWAAPAQDGGCGWVSQDLRGTSRTRPPTPSDTH